MRKRKKIVDGIDPCNLGFTSTPSVRVPIVYSTVMEEKVNRENYSDFIDDDIAIPLMPKRSIQI